MTTTHNVVDKYRGWEMDLIRKDLKAKSFPFAVLMDNVSADYNIGTFIRNGNIFGARTIFYRQDKKHYDNRGTVGAHHYSHVTHLKTLDEVAALKEHFRFVAIETELPGSISIYKKMWLPNTLVIFGSEGSGISKEILEMCTESVHVPMYGSVRSLNVGTTSGIIMSHMAEQFKNE